MKRLKAFRIWWYVRQGYQVYFAFIFMSINTLTVTYYLAIERVPILEIIFPSFPLYVSVMILAAVPLLAITGYLHYRKVPGYEAQAATNIENNPYVYKLPPGFWLHVVMPYFLIQSKLLTKISKNEKISDEEMKTVTDLQKKMENLTNGGYVGLGKKARRTFGNNEN
jgi:hypothetical protein